MDLTFRWLNCYCEVIFWDRDKIETPRSGIINPNFASSMLTTFPDRISKTIPNTRKDSLETLSPGKNYMLGGSPYPMKMGIVLLFQSPGIASSSKILLHKEVTPTGTYLSCSLEYLCNHPAIGALAIQLLPRLPLYIQYDHPLIVVIQYDFI